MVELEFRVRPVTRYIVTRYAKANGPGHDAMSLECRGEYENADVAFEVGYALCKAEHDKLGWPPGDMRIQYPQHLTGSKAGTTSNNPYRDFAGKDYPTQNS